MLEIPDWKSGEERKKCPEVAALCRASREKRRRLVAVLDKAAEGL
jgi:hypothetical protein